MCALLWDEYNTQEAGFLTSFELQIFESNQQVNVSTYFLTSSVSLDVVT